MKTNLPILTVIVGCTLVGFLQVNEASAGCRINIQGRNDGPHPVNLSYHDSKVKVKGGTWKKIFRSDDDLRVEAGTQFHYVYDAALGCNLKRRWVFRLIKGEGCAFEHIWYKPSSTEWFAKGTTDISFYELSGKCNR